jgi:3-isopropylmalate/(R)-2-methylmalate dehydratase small subunit
MRQQLHARPGARIRVDLERQIVTAPDGRQHAFTVHPLRRGCLLEGLDDISLTTKFADAVEQFEAAYRREFSWLGQEAPSADP